MSIFDRQKFPPGFVVEIEGGFDGKYVSQPAAWFPTQGDADAYVDLVVEGWEHFDGGQIDLDKVRIFEVKL